MKDFRCDYCSGYVNPRTYKCEYCGTQYERPHIVPYTVPEISVVVTPPRCDCYGVQLDFDITRFKDMIDAGVPVEQEIRKEMAHKIADLIDNNLTIYEDYDITTMKKRFRGSLRVVKPDYKF